MPIHYGGWYPQRGDVTMAEVTKENGEKVWRVSCANCKKERDFTIRAAAVEVKGYHYCPHGTVGSLPACPDCGSHTKRCKRPSGHDAAEWHAARVEEWRKHVPEEEEEVVIEL